ncbi:unnamed protein product [Pleuronectes platessa]|uniref:Uncharacterized protein n=1 Tax=Pleuronectes platessa TaxID=8262 RepID=A0A9N7VKE0_PLEPL|nr:unnamed protein product [Pleuronectes platessa]
MLTTTLSQHPWAAALVSIHGQVRRREHGGLLQHVLHRHDALLHLGIAPAVGRTVAPDPGRRGGLDPAGGPLIHTGGFRCGGAEGDTPLSAKACSPGEPRQTPLNSISGNHHLSASVRNRTLRRCALL